jgi:hypothetical protein
MGHITTRHNTPSMAAFGVHAFYIVCTYRALGTPLLPCEHALQPSSRTCPACRCQLLNCSGHNTATTQHTQHGIIQCTHASASLRRIITPCHMLPHLPCELLPAWLREARHAAPAATRPWPALRPPRLPGPQGRGVHRADAWQQPVGAAAAVAAAV